MKNIPDLDAVINYLTGPINLQVNDLIVALGIERSYYYSWRRSTKRDRRIELAKRLMELYAAYFPDGQIPAQAYSTPPGAAVERIIAPSSERKYIDLLEKTVEDLRAERDRLRQEVEQLLRHLKEDVGQIKKQLES